PGARDEVGGSGDAPERCGRGGRTRGGVRARPRQGPHRGPGLAGVRIEPPGSRPRPRGDADARAGRRLGRGHRPRHGARLPPPDGPAQAHRSGRPRRDDETALDRLLEDRWRALVAYVLGRVGDVELAKDIAQEAFVRLWERRNTLDPGRSVVAYLYQVARRRAIDELRRQAVHA